MKSAVLKFVGYLLTFLVVYGVMNFWQQPVMPANPILQMTNIDGQTIHLADSQEPVLLYFWGSWCGVCRQTSSNINQLAKEQYHVVSIAVNSGTDAEIQQYLSQNTWSFQVVNDSDGKIFANWQGKVTPSYVILHQGKMKQGFVGIHPLFELKLRIKLAKLI